MDGIELTSTEYVYISDRLVGDLYDRIAASKRSKRVGDVSLKLPFLSVNSTPRNLGANRYQMVSEVTEAISDVTGTLAYAAHFVRFQAELTWYDLHVREQDYRVAWMVADERGNEGRFLVSLCGSIENYFGYQAGPVSRGGWKPSAVEGLSNLVASFSKERKYSDSYPEDKEEIKDLALEAAHISMCLQDHEDSEYLGSGRMEVLARIYWGIKGDEMMLRRVIKNETDVFDGIYVGTPLWVRSISEEKKVFLSESRRHEVSVNPGR